MTVENVLSVNLPNSKDSKELPREKEIEEKKLGVERLGVFLDFFTKRVSWETRRYARI